MFDGEVAVVLGGHCPFAHMASLVAPRRSDSSPTVRRTTRRDVFAAVRPAVGSGRYIVGIIAIAVVYWLVARWGLIYTAGTSPISTFWPSAGVAFSALLVFGRRMWPGVVVGSALTNFGEGAHWASALVAGLGTGLSYHMGITVAQRLFGGRIQFRRVVDVGHIALAVLIGSLLASLVGTLSFVHAGITHSSDFWRAYTAWFVGDSLGILLVTPLVLSYFLSSPPVLGSRLEALLLTLATCLAAWYAFVGGPKTEVLANSFAVFPPLVWAAVRFGHRGAATTNFLVGVFAIHTVWLERGMVEAVTTVHALTEVGLFLLVVCLTILLLAVALSQARETQERLLQSEARYRENLERRVVERTTELNRLNAELESFSYSVAHDLRGPLRTIAGFSHLLQEDERERLSPEGRENLDVIRQAAIRMGRLVDALLGLSRIHRTALEIEPFNLTEMAWEVAREVEAAAQVAVEVRWEIEPEMSATADPRLVRLLLMNLFENALKFSRHRRPAVIRCGKTEWDGETAYYVADNGIGFERQFADRLFQPFERLHGPREYEGDGIGLATVDRVVRRHRGRIRAEGELDQGATFTFTLTAPN